MMNQGCSTTSKIKAKGVDGVEREWELKEGDFFQCWPDGTGFEIVFKGFTNSWGYDWDDYGNWFCNDNEGPHLIHLVEGGDYGYSLTNRHDGKPGTLPPVETDHTQHHGYLVQTGLTIYSGDAFPKEYQGNILQGAANMHKIIRDSVDENGASFFAEKRDDLTASDDQWHRPLALAVGPDGAVYMADWYNEILAHVEHPLDSPRRDKTHGRIYRIAWKGTGKSEISNLKSEIPDLRKASAEELIANLRSDNKWLRRTSQRLLAWKINRHEIEPKIILPLLAAAESPRTRCHALWTLEESHTLYDDHGHELTYQEIYSIVERLFSDPDPHVRVAALRTARHIDFPLYTYGLAKHVLPRAHDPNDMVKYEAAMLISKYPSAPRPVLPLQDDDGKPLMPEIQTEDIADILLSADWDDPFLAHAFGEAIRPYREKIVTQGFTIGARGLNGEGEKFVPALLRLADPRTEPLLIAMLQLPDLKPHLAEEVVSGLQTYKTPAVSRALVDYLAAHPDLSIPLARPILEDLRRRPAGQKGDDRAASIHALSALAEHRKDGLLREVYLTAAHCGAAELSPQLIQAFHNAEPKIAEAAVLASGELKLADAGKEINDLAARSEGRMKWAAIRAASNIGCEAPIEESFAPALGNPDSAADALRGLKSLNHPAAGTGSLADVMARVPSGKVALNRSTVSLLRDWINAEPDQSRRAEYLKSLTSTEGILRDWKLIGPFPNPDTKGHATPYEPESELKADAEYETFGKKIRWQPYRADDPNGIVNLMGFQPNDHAVAYGWTTYLSPEARRATLYCGSDDSIKVWINGKLVHDNLVDRGMILDQDQVEVDLQKGENTILVKCGQNGGGWNFHARIATLPPQVAADPENLETRALYMSGNPDLGEKVFFGSVGCFRCHSIGDKGGRVGPDLTQVARYNPKSYIVRSILKPSEEIAEGFGGVTVTMKDNQSFEGFIHRETPTEVYLVTGEGKTLTLGKDKIRERRARSASGMPDDIAKTLKPQELVDLVAFLESRR